MKAFILTQVLIAVLLIGIVGSIYFLLNRKAPGNYSQTGPVTTAPASLILNLDSPDDDSLVFSSPVVISGKTLPNLNVLISSNSDDFVIQSKGDGSFSDDLDLNLGPNEITVMVFDATGNIREAKRTIYYSKEKI